VRQTKSLPPAQMPDGGSRLQPAYLPIGDDKAREPRRGVTKRRRDAGRRPGSRVAAMATPPWQWQGVGAAGGASGGPGPRAGGR